jgi:hypothetical protein
MPTYLVIPLAILAALLILIGLTALAAVVAGGRFRWRRARPPRARRWWRIGARVFLPVGQSTVLHDRWCTRYLERCGLIGIEPRDREDSGAFARHVTFNVSCSDDGLLLLGGMIAPPGRAGTRWTPKVARETAKFLGGLSDPRQKAMVNAIAAAVLADFFALGLHSWSGSPMSSESRVQLERNGSTPGTGAPWSASSPA